MNAVAVHAFLIVAAVSAAAIIIFSLGSWLLDALARASGRHRYLSTACEHGYHPRCRRRCKFCSASCRCACHRMTGHVEVGVP